MTSSWWFLFLPSTIWLAVPTSQKRWQETPVNIVQDRDARKEDISSKQNAILLATGLGVGAWFWSWPFPTTAAIYIYTHTCANMILVLSWKLYIYIYLYTYIYMHIENSKYRDFFSKELVSPEPFVLVAIRIILRHALPISRAEVKNKRVSRQLRFSYTLRPAQTIQPQWLPSTAKILFETKQSSKQIWEPAYYRQLAARSRCILWS